jgi:hypothetical protein
VTPPATAGGAVGGRARRAPDPWLLAVLATLCIILAIEPWPVGVFQDDGIYAVLAKSLATGEGYRFIQLPGAPNATHYPPGYPLLLAGLWKLYPEFPQNVTVFKFANAVLVGVAAYGTWTFAVTRVGMNRVPAAMATALFTACSPIVLLSVMVLSEPLFLAAMLPALAAAERASDSGRPRDAVIAGLAGALLAMIRTLGALLIPATVLALAWQRKWKAAAIVGFTGVCAMLPWQLWVGAHAHEVPAVFIGKYGSYAGWLAEAVRTEGPLWIARVSWHNLSRLSFETWTHTGTVLGPFWLRATATTAVCALLAFGLHAALPRIRATVLFTLMYLGVVIAWPFAPARFVWGIWPLVGILFVLGATRLVSMGSRAADPGPRWPFAARRWLPRVAVALLLAGYAKFNAQSVAEHWWTQVQGSVGMRAKPMAEWVRANTRPDAVLATDDDLLIYLYTGRRTLPNGAFTAQEHLTPQTPDFAVSTLRRILGTYDVDYVLAGTEFATYAVRGLVGGTPPELRIVTGLRHGAVFAPVARGLP